MVAVKVPVTVVPQTAVPLYVVRYTVIVADASGLATCAARDAGIVHVLLVPMPVPIVPDADPME